MVKRRVVKKNKFNLSMFSKKPIIKNGYVMALLVFIALVVAFNIADSYDYYSGDEVTGMVALGQSFGRITDLLNEVSQFIFKDLLEDTFLGTFISYTDMIIRLIIFTTLYLLISSISSWTGIVKHEKYAKTISALIALLTAVFVPQDVIYTIFGTPLAVGLFGGGLGLIIWGIVIFLPLYILFKWLKISEDRFVRFIIAFLFLGWLFVITSVESRVTIVTDLRDLWDIMISLGVLSCLVGAGWGLWRGFTGAGGIKEKAEEGIERFIGRGGAKGEWGRTKEHFKGLWGGKGMDEREKLVKADKLAQKYANAIKQALGKGKSPNKVLSRYLSEAGRLGVGARRAKKILNSKGIRV